MKNQNKINFNDFILGKESIKIELGCGKSKKEGYIGIDELDLDGVDFIANFEHGLYFIPDNSVDEVLSIHLLEHIQNLEKLITEIHRILKPSGINKVIVPHFSNPFYYSDYTHKNFFGLYTFEYFSSSESKLRRKVPNFYSNSKFEIVDRKLIFKAPHFPIVNKLYKIFEVIINSSSLFQEIYESFFTGLLSCTEIIFTMKPTKII